MDLRMYSKVQDVQITKISKHARWNDSMYVGLSFLFSLVEIKVFGWKFLKLKLVQDGVSLSRLEFFIFRDRLGSTFFAALQQLFFGQVIIILTLAVWKDAQGSLLFLILIIQILVLLYCWWWVSLIFVEMNKLHNEWHCAVFKQDLELWNFINQT